MTTIRDLANYLEKIAPLQYQMSYDNSGLLVGDENATVKGVLVSLDCIEATVEEAVSRGCNVIVAHHPIIFGGLKRLVGSNYVQRTVIKAIQHGVAIYAIHTNLDSVLHNGVNTEIAARLDLHNLSILAPDHQHSPDGHVGAGLVGNLSTGIQVQDFFAFLKDRMQVAVIKHTAITSQMIDRVALCGGSGGFLLQAAKESGAQVFITSDYKYHEFFDADGDIIIADIGHYESEQFTVDLLQRLVSEKFSTFAALKSDVITNPVTYYY